ncbi:MAG: AMP-binding protein [Deltaproteobacteria bacterium]|nr:AMP-binding protein [Deltaproteobacteria bacterium]
MADMARAEDQCKGIEDEALAHHTLPQILALQAERLGRGQTALRKKDYGIWKSYSWSDYLEFTRLTALGLKALGFNRGDRLAIITDNHPEWLFSELGAQSMGGITVNLFTSSVSDELAGMLNRTGSAFVVAQDQEQVDKLLDKRDRLCHVKRIIYIDKTGMRTYEDDSWLMSYQELLEAGRKKGNEDSELFCKELMQGRPDDSALMITTSGTTGVAKLAMLSHSNFTAIASSWLAVLDRQSCKNWFSISPPPWIVDQMWGIGVALLGGTIMNFPETVETITEDFREIGPNVIITSSRFWENLASQIRVKIADAGFINKLVFRLAEKIGNAVIDNQSRGLPVSFGLRIAHGLASIALYRPLLDRIGCGAVVSAFTGGHPISPDVIRFFRAIGLNLKQCYGLTEACGIFQVQPDNEVKDETVGLSLPGITVKISSDQEVLVGGRNIFRGYYNDFDATQKAFDEQWLKTGDAGYLDENNHLVIIGRKEDIIRNKDGSAFSPDFIETRLKFSPYIQEAVTFGEGRTFITALINIDMGNVGSWAEDQMIPYTTYTDLSQQTAVENLILQEVREVNKRLPVPMRIKKFIILYKLLDADDEELTRTGKVRRRFVYGLYIKLIEAMYNNEESVAVKAVIKYRDGQVNVLETMVKIVNVESDLPRESQE